jgi:hypothetical protein
MLAVCAYNIDFKIPFSSWTFSTAPGLQEYMKKVKYVYSRLWNTSLISNPLKKMRKSVKVKEFGRFSS